MTDLIHFATHFGSTEPAHAWFYLVVKSDGTLTIPRETVKRLGNHEIDSFFKTAVKMPDYGFVLVDITTDSRLEAALQQLPGGASLMDRIMSEAPLVLISSIAIPKVTDANTIECFPIRNYDKDIDVIYQKMGIHAPATRRAAIRFFKRLNSYVKLEPNIQGIGFNISKMIADLLDKLDGEI
jgi:hypothetical protein